MKVIITEKIDELSEFIVNSSEIISYFKFSKDVI